MTDQPAPLWSLVEEFKKEARYVPASHVAGIAYRNAADRLESLIRQHIAALESRGTPISVECVLQEVLGIPTDGPR